MTTLTADQLKKMAKAIRERENDVLGQQLSNTTVLNALVKSLGLADNFSGFVKKQAIEVNTSMMIVFDNKDVETLPCEDNIAKDIEAFAEKLGCVAELVPAAHGFNVLYLGMKVDTQTFEEKVANPVREMLNTLVADDELLPMRGENIWQDNGVSLVANFMYFDNDQICSASLSEMAWRNRAGLNLDDTQALLVLGGDVEIEPEYDSSDIMLQDVMYDVKFYDGP